MTNQLALAVVLAMALAACSSSFKCNMFGGSHCANTPTATDTPSAGAGQSCEHANCDAHSYCNLASSTCVALRPKGSACESSQECDGQCANNVCE